MKQGKAVRPYKGIVSKDGLRTNFSISDSNYDRATQTYSNGTWYTLSVEGVNFPIENKNPEGYRIVPNNITGITFNEFNGKTYTTVWCDDVDIQDKDGKTIVQGSKATRRKVGTSASQIKAEVPEGFSQLNDDDVPF